MLKKLLPLSLALVALALILSACPGASKGTAVNFNLNQGNEPPQLDPQISTDTTSFAIINGVFEGLVRFDQEGNLIPGMAEKWDITDGGKVYTFKMRKGAKWSNGDPVTAADFEYGIKRALDPETASEYSYILYDIVGAAEANGGEAGLDQVGVKAEGDKLTITLNTPVPYFGSILAFGTCMPANQKFIESLPEGKVYGADADTMVYNGPWTITSWTHDDKLIMSKNKSYWNAKAIKLDTITNFMVPDSSASISMFYNGDLDIQGVPGNRREEMAGKGYPIFNYSDGSCFYLECNVSDKIVGNLKIRQALSAAIDRDSFVKNVIKDASLPARAFVPPFLPGLKKDFRSEVGDLISDDPAKAKELLAEGMKELGISKMPKIVMLSGDTDVAKDQAAAVQEMWRKNLGIDCTIESMPFKARLQRMTAKDFQVVFAGWGPDYNDPMTFIDIWITNGQNNHTYWSNATYDDLVAKAKVELDPTVRMKAMYDAERLLMAEMPIIPTYFRARDWTQQSNVSGVVRRAVGGDPDLYWTEKK